MLLALIITLFVFTTPTSTPQPPEFPEPGSYTARKTYDNLQRSYRIYIPEGYTPDAEPVPLLIVMHGAGGTAQGTEAFTGFNAVADREGFIVVYPNSSRAGWADGRPNVPTDDVGFISQLIDEMAEGVNIDLTRVYVTGFSAGGMMALRVGCNLPDKIAAVVSVASTQPIYQREACDVSAPIPVMFVLGTLDPVVTWQGSDYYFSARNSIAYWLSHNGCTGEAADIIEILDGDESTPEWVRRETFSQCEDNTEVTIYGAVGGGHTWPGHPFEASIELGETSMDIDATEVIWEFFTRHALTEDVSNAEKD
jgi:polyhydroxybutyrate depolymerase